MSALEPFLAANRRYAADFDARGLPPAPARRLAVVTCMDARMHPERFLGLAVGEAHVIRNAGGRASDDAVRSLIVSSHMLGTRHVMVIHHTDCGMATFTNDEMRARLLRDTGADATDIDFLAFEDLEQSVRLDVARIRQVPFLLEDITVDGFVYDVATGELHAVDTPESG
jgi:carbonic anhydrase